MTGRIADLTIEHLGSDATEDDLERFRGWCRELMQRDSILTEKEAIDMLWGNGDYAENAKWLGLEAA